MPTRMWSWQGSCAGHTNCGVLGSAGSGATVARCPTSGAIDWPRGGGKNSSRYYLAMTQKQEQLVDSVQKIHVRFDPDLMTTVKERAITEILLELCNVELEVEITESEVRELLEIYMEVYKAKPFIGLRELVESDGGVAMFFRMFKEVVVPIR